MRLSAALAVTLLVLTLAFRPLGADATGARLVQVFTWDPVERDLGGLSAIVMRNQGSQALALTDKSVLFELSVQRDAQGMTGVTPIRHVALITDDDAIFDSEGLAVVDGQSAYVSFEQDNRIMLFSTETGNGTRIPTPPAFGGMAWNKGLEALAINDQGHLFTLAERPRTQRRGFAVWHWDGTKWQRPFHLWARDGFLAVSAEFGPDGRFYLLERKVTILGFQTRLRRWDVTPNIVRNEEVVLITKAGQFGNLEGLSLWQNADGQTIVSMVADDNFWWFFRTQLVEFALTE